MIRTETPEGWTLITHPDHAELAAQLAEAWGNDTFEPPPPLEAIIEAVRRHDDAWKERDSQPVLTPEGRPSAFSRDLVDGYEAFEEIDLEDYLRVRGEATETVARENPYAAILVSRHTVNLLSDQADLSGLSEEQRQKHAAFLEQQRQRQEELKTEVKDHHEALAPYLAEGRIERGFRFLQACDSASLMLCVGMDQEAALRWQHPTRFGFVETIKLHPEGENTWLVHPSPFPKGELKLEIACKHIRQKTFEDEAQFQSMYAQAQPEKLPMTLITRETI